MVVSVYPPLDISYVIDRRVLYVGRNEVLLSSQVMASWVCVSHDLKHMLGYHGYMFYD